MRTKISLKAAIDEVLDVPDFEWQAYIDAHTGEVFSLPPVDDEQWADWHDESDPDTRIRDIDAEHILPLPNRFDVDEFRIMQRFAQEQPEALELQLRTAMRGKGAFRRFKDTVHQLGLLDAWFAYLHGAVADIVREHLEEHTGAIELVDDVSPKAPDVPAVGETKGPPEPFGKEHAERYDVAW